MVSIAGIFSPFGTHTTSKGALEQAEDAVSQGVAMRRRQTADLSYDTSTFYASYTLIQLISGHQVIAEAYSVCVWFYMNRILLQLRCHDGCSTEDHGQTRGYLVGLGRQSAS